MITTLICTTGTSLLTNLKRFCEGADTPGIAPEQREIARACADQDMQALGRYLSARDAADPLLGAEINSIHSMIEEGHAAPGCRVILLHSQTDEGRRVARLLHVILTAHDHEPVEAVEIRDLQDSDPHRFRLSGLRHLASEMSRVVREYGPASCALNATGGYKAQIAIAVALGQALGVSVFYKHERFPVIVKLQALPLALDMDTWLEMRPLLERLAGGDTVLESDYRHLLNDKTRSLVESVSIDRQKYVELTPLGQVFHEALRDRYGREARLPADASEKCAPKFEDAGWPGQWPQAEQYLNAVTRENRWVIRCRTVKFNPDLPKRNLFKATETQIEGVYSDGTRTMYFIVETTAKSSGEAAAVASELNLWLDRRGRV